MSYCFRGLLLPVLLLALATPMLAAPQIADPAFAETIERSRDVLAPRLALHPGLAVSVAVDGEIVWSEGMGFADREAGVLATPQTRFRLYSVAKTFTGTLAARLSGQDRLDLDAPITEYLPELPDRFGVVTERQLLGHLGGIRNYKKGEWLEVSRRRCDTARASMTDFVDDRLRSKPGKKFAYTSFGFVLASAVIEGATDQPFVETLREEIFEPAGMVATGLDTPAEHDQRTAAFYWEARDGSIERTPPELDNSCKAGGGGLLTSSEDLVRFGVAVLSGVLVDQEGMELITTTQRDGKGEPTGYSLGWGVSDDRERIAHSGGSPGGRSYLLLDRPSGLVVAIVSNFEGERMHQEASEIRGLFVEAAEGGSDGAAPSH